VLLHVLAAPPPGMCEPTSGIVACNQQYSHVSLSTVGLIEFSCRLLQLPAHPGRESRSSTYHPMPALKGLQRLCLLLGLRLVADVLEQFHVQGRYKLNPGLPVSVADGSLCC
jgi:hypothetical protein